MTRMGVMLVVLALFVLAAEGWVVERQGLVGPVWSAPLAAGDPASPAGETYYLTEEFTHAFAGAELAYATYYGKQVLYFEGGKLVGLDPQTSLVRWQGGNLTTVRQLVDAGDNVLLIGEHLELISKDGGKRVWDFPLNCFDAAQ